MNPILSDCFQQPAGFCVQNCVQSENMCSEALFHFFRSGLQLAVPDVGVDVHGGGQLGVAKEHLRRFGIHAAFQQGGGVAVPDLVCRDGDAAGVSVGIVQRGEVIICQEAAVRLREQVAPPQLFREQLGQRRKQRNVPASGVRLRLFNVCLLYTSPSPRDA